MSLNKIAYAYTIESKVTM